MDFVNIEIARKLKELNFQEPCAACYDGYDMLSTYTDIFNPKNYNVGGSSHTSSPTKEQVVKWLMENHLIYVIPELNYYENKLTYTVSGVFKNGTHRIKSKLKNIDDAIELAIDFINNEIKEDSIEKPSLWKRLKNTLSNDLIN